MYFFYKNSESKGDFGVNIRLLSPSASLDAITCQTSIRLMDSVTDKSAQADLL
jgi:hypothetical protein